ncbi:MAG: hypothetical protein WKH64_06595 [Chloroflexia bacterium]
MYDPALLGGPGVRTSRLVWRVEVRARGIEPVRELVLVDALRGSIALNFNQVAHAKSRFICDNGNAVDPTNDDKCLAPPYNRVEGGAATGNADIDLAYDYSGITYDFFKNRFGRDSLNNAGLALRSTVRYCPDSGNCPYGNAYWNGVQMVYGAGYASADDVVGHELAHGVTDFSAHLFYYYQAGAIASRSPTCSVS